VGTGPLSQSGFKCKRKVITYLKIGCLPLKDKKQAENLLKSSACFYLALGQGTCPSASINLQTGIGWIPERFLVFFFQVYAVPFGILTCQGQVLVLH
jgi:hypothetical protein